MSAFVLNRGYDLQLPNSYVEIDNEEMEYVDGGGWTFNNVYRGSEAWYKIAEFAGITYASIRGMIASFGLAIATSVTIAGAIAAVAGFCASFVSAITNSYNACAAIVFTYKYGGFRHSGVQVPFWPTLNVGVVGRI